MHLEPEITPLADDNRAIELPVLTTWLPSLAYG